MSKAIRLGIVGTGLIITEKHWPALSALLDEFAVVALVNRSRPKAEVIADAVERASGSRPAIYADYPSLLANEQLDAISIALPPALNPEVVQAGLAAGCHVIAEKPIACTLEEGKRMLPWGEEYGRVFMVAENFRYVDSYRRAARLVAEGAVGRPLTAQWFMCAYMAPDNRYVVTPWRQEPLHPGGFLSDAGVHHMAVMRTILGEVVTVQAAVASYRSDLKPFDTVAAVLSWDSGVISSYHMTYAVPGPVQPLQIIGSEGVVLAGRTWSEWWQGEKRLGRWDEVSPADGLVAMYRDFSQAIRTGSEPFATPARSWVDLQLIVALMRSAETGRELRVEDVTE